MSETIAQSHSDTYAVTVGTAARVIVAGSGNAQAGTAVGSAQGTIEVPRQVTVHNAHGSQVLYLGWGSDVTTSNGVPVAAGGYRQFALTSTDELWAVASGSGTDTRVFVLHGKGKAAPFDVLSLSPTLWLDASDESTIQETSGSVTQWDNKGSLGNFAQGTAALQPTTGASTQNGLNVIDFAGDVLDSADAASAYNALHDGTDYIVAAVVKFGTTSNPDALYGLMGTGYTQSQHGMYIAYDDRSGSSFNNRLIGYVANGVSPQPVSNISGDDVISPNTFSVLTAFTDPDNGTAADRSKLYVDGGAAIANNTETGSPSSSDASNQMQIGSISLDQFVLTGSIAELVVVSGADATEANRSELATYLADKWGITL